MLRKHTSYTNQYSKILFTTRR